MIPAGRTSAAGYPTQAGTAPRSARALPSAPVEDPFDDLRSKEGQAQDAADVGTADPFDIRDLCQRAEAPLVQNSLPAVRTRESLDQGAVGLRLGAGHDRAPVRCDDPLASAAALEK
jgi:hypothetical protein